MDGFQQYWLTCYQQMLKDSVHYRRQIARNDLHIMEKAHVFVVQDKKVAGLLQQTDNKPHEGMRLPFRICWIECPFEFEGHYYPGILLYEARPHSDSVDDITGRPVLKWGASEKGAEDTFVDGDVDKHIFYATLSMNPKAQKDPNYVAVTFMRNTLWGVKASTEHPATQFEKRERKFVERMACNFIDLLATPDVKIVNVQRNEKRVNKRRPEGAAPEPMQFSRVLLQGEVKRYVDSLEADKGSKGIIKHAFEVRGHFRHLRAERYQPDPENRCGCGCKRVSFVPPHTRGQGILISRFHVLEARDKNE